MQPRDTCYIADEGLPELQYSGYQPPAHSWNKYPPLKDIRETVSKPPLSRPSLFFSSTDDLPFFCKQLHEALPGSRFNSLLLNRYNGPSDYVSWHSDDEKIYGHAPEIASVSLGCERDFVLRKKKPSKSANSMHLGCVRLCV